MKTGLVLVLLSAMILFSSTYVAIGQAWYNSTYPWSQSQHDAQHTGASDSTSPSSNSTIWTYEDITYGVPSALVVADGRVFVIKTDGSSFYVLDETTGARVLSDVSVGVAGLQAGAAYYDGKLIFTSGYWIYNSGSIRCFDATTRDLLWNRDISEGMISHLPTVSGNRVYYGSTNNYTYCVEDGAQIWYKKLGGPIYSAPAVDDNLLCIGCDDGKLYAFDISGAQPVSLWNFTAGNAIRGPITIQGDKVYFSGYLNSQLYVLNKTNGDLIWSWTSTQIGRNLEIAVANGIVYVGHSHSTGGTGLYALDSNVAPGNYTSTSPEPFLWMDGVVTNVRGIAVAGNKVFYTGSGYACYAKNASTGLLLWTITLSGGYPTAPIVADGHVFVADQARVYCIGSAYPSVTNTYNLNIGGQPFTVDIETNSTVSNIDVSNITTTMNMSFTVESSRGTGMCDIVMPNDMLGGLYNVTVDGQAPWSSEIAPINATHTSLYFTYNGTGKYTVEITGSTAIPEFTLPITILSCGIITLVIIGLRKRRLFT